MGYSMVVLYGCLINNRFGSDSRCPNVSNTLTVDDQGRVGSSLGQAQSFTTGGCVTNPFEQYSYQQWVPPQRKVTKTITTKEYDEKGRVVKETITEEVEEVPGYYRNRYVPYYTWNTGGDTTVLPCATYTT